MLNKQYRKQRPSNTFNDTEQEKLFSCKPKVLFGNERGHMICVPLVLQNFFED